MILLDSANVLLVRNVGNRYWALPGGKIHGRESPKQCLERELAEELGLSGIRLDYKLGEYGSELEGKRDTIHLFVMRTEKTDFREGWELDDAAWFPLSRLPEDLSPATGRRLTEFRNGARDLAAAW